MIVRRIISINYLCIVLLSLLILCPGWVSPTSAGAGVAEKKNVLILNSYHQGFKWTDDITRGAVSALSPVSGDTRIFVEYMDTKWVRDESYFRELTRIYRHKYSRIRFDLIISSDNDAFDFLRRHRDEIFGKTPVVFCGVNYFRESDLAGTTLFTGVSETADLRESLELALKLHPSAKKVFIINDIGLSGAITGRELERIEPLFRGRARFVYEKSSDLDSILRDVEALSPDTLIFYTFFYGDPARQSYENSDCISRIAGVARVPVYGSWDFNLGYGMVGGKLTSGYDQGAAAGRMGLRILRGERVERIPPVLRSRTQYTFDYLQMMRFGIPKSALPEGSVVINEPESYHRVHKNVVWAALAGIASLSALTLLLLHVNRRIKRSEELLQKAHDGLEIKVGERTLELSRLNEELRMDIEARQRAEEELRQANRDLVREVEIRKAAEKVTQKSLSILRATIESTNDGILVVDREGRIGDWNRKFLELWGIPDDVILQGRDEQALAYVKEQLSDPDGFTIKVEELYSRPEEESRDILKFRDGRVFDRYSRPQYLHDRIVGRVWSFRDITEQKKMEGEILKAQRLESLGVLAGGIAHDFNNLLTGIMGNISLAKMYVNQGGKAYTRLQAAEKSCDLTMGLTRQLITFSKGGSPVKKVDSMSRIIMESAGFVLSGSNVRCDFSLPDDLWSVEVDSGQMNQVINNLIINADQAMPAGGLISVRAENVFLDGDGNLPLPPGRCVHILISDQGVGIPEENLPKIFDPYFTTKRKGSGLGLASVYSIIRKHGGHVDVESRPGAGTTFHIYLPAMERRLAPEPRLPERRGRSMARGRVLVVDDEAVAGEAARDVLGNLGYGIDVCEDGAAALELYRKARESKVPYVFVFIALTVPGGMGGKAVMKKLLEMDPDVRGVVMGGYAADPILAHYREYGFCGVVTKPLRMEELRALLESLG